MLKLDATMTVKEILQRHPGAVSLFVKHNMLCIGCPAEAFHTLADVARIHGYEPESLIETVRKAVETEGGIPMKATDELKAEHEGIKLMLQILQSVSNRLAGGKAVPAEDLSGITEFLTVFVDKCHHGKEEEFLFPALEAAGVPREGGPIGVMLSEHKQGRQLVAQFRDALARFSSGDKGASADVQEIARQYVDLLTQHIEKENLVLFAMADAKLDPNKDSELFQAFEQLEKERIGPGRHEEFHALLEQLQGAYLK